MLSVGPPCEAACRWALRQTMELLFKGSALSGGMSVVPCAGGGGVQEAIVSAWCKLGQFYVFQRPPFQRQRLEQWHERGTLCRRRRSAGGSRECMVSAWAILFLYPFPYCPEVDGFALEAH